MAKRKILVSGASIAGPVSAYWLNRAGFDVVLVERTAEPRLGGYAIDIRGPAVTILDRMGVLQAIREHHVEVRDMVFMNHKGKTLASVPIADLAGTEEGFDLEVRRGSLSSELYRATKGTIDYRFNDHVVALSQDDDGVDVQFASGAKERFDLVVAADGMHSKTRELVLGPEEPLHRYLGYFFGLFTMPNIWGVHGAIQVFSDVGRAAAIFGVSANENVSVLLSTAVPEPPFELIGDPVAQRAFFTRAFADVMGKVPQVLETLQTADDLFCDMVSQIRSRQWSSGRVALIGDSASAPSFLTGQGTSLAIVEGYMLAQALARHEDYREAFVAYDRGTRPFVERNQSLAKPGGWMLIPNSKFSARLRMVLMRMMPLLRRFAKPGKSLQEVYNALDLPAFPDRKSA